MRNFYNVSQREMRCVPVLIKGGFIRGFGREREGEFRGGDSVGIRDRVRRAGEVSLSAGNTRQRSPPVDDCVSSPAPTLANATSVGESCWR